MKPWILQAKIFESPIDATSVDFADLGVLWNLPNVSGTLFVISIISTRLYSAFPTWSSDPCNSGIHL